MASTLGLAEEGSVFEQLGDEPPDPLSGAHLALREQFEASQEALHPWATAMYERGFSFNGHERSHLFLGAGGAGFVDLSEVAGGDSPLDGRAAIAADFDDDGDPDLFVHNVQRARHQLFRNDGARGGFLELRLRATGSQWEAIGAEVIVTGPHGPVAQVLSRGSGHASCQPPAILCGLGAAQQGAVQVRWPSGALEEFGRLAGGRYLLVEGAGEAAPRATRGVPLPDPWPPGLKLGLGAQVPPLVLLDEQGAHVTLDPQVAAAPGRLLLTFWASYCGPCRRELVQLAELDAAEDTRVVAISVDVPDDRPAARALLKQLAPRLAPRFIAMDEASNGGGLDALIDLVRLPVPTTVEIDPQGRIRAVQRGAAVDAPSGR